MRIHGGRGKLAFVGLRAAQDGGIGARGLMVLHRCQVRERVHARRRRLSRRGQLICRRCAVPSTHVRTICRTHRGRGRFGEARGRVDMLRERGRGHAMPDGS